MLVASIGLSQVLPGLASVLLIQRGRHSAALLVLGAAAFVPGAMIVFLTLTSHPKPSAILLCCSAWSWPGWASTSSSCVPGWPDTATLPRAGALYGVPADTVSA